MIDPSPIWQTRISSRIFFKDSTCTWSKDDWPPQYDRPGSHLEYFFSKIQHAHGQKMIDPPYDRPESHLEFSFKDSTCTWSKDDWPPLVWQTRISPRILKYRFSLHMVKDDWPWRRLLHERPFTREGTYLFSHYLCSSSLTCHKYTSTCCHCLSPHHPLLPV